MPRNQKVLCPFATMQQVDKGRCVKERCAWWNKDKNKCSVTLIGECVNYLAALKKLTVI